MPADIEQMRVTPYYDFDAALKDADVVMMLRLQNERMTGQFIPRRADIAIFTACRWTVWRGRRAMPLSCIPADEPRCGNRLQRG
jgi:hypothetical protein